MKFELTDSQATVLEQARRDSRVRNFARGSGSITRRRNAEEQTATNANALLSPTSFS